MHLAPVGGRASMRRRRALLAGLARGLFAALGWGLLTRNALGVAAVRLAIVLVWVASTHGGSPLLTRRNAVRAGGVHPESQVQEQSTWPNRISKTCCIRSRPR